MLSESELERIKLAKESYPNEVVFFLKDGLFVLTGSDLKQLDGLGLQPSGTWVAFEWPAVHFYMAGLARQGLSVRIATAPRHTSLQSSRNRSRTATITTWPAQAAFIST